MSPALKALLFRIYRNLRTDIAAEVEGIFPVATFPTENAAANDVLDALLVDVRAKRSDDGLLTARTVLSSL